MGIQDIADAISNSIKYFEDLDSNAVILNGCPRSIQLEHSTCGVHSIFVILSYFGKRVSLDRLKRELRTDHDGTTEEDVRRVLRKYRLKFRVEPNASIKSIRRAIDAATPVLVSTFHGDHWCVVYGYSDRVVYVSDSSVLKNLRCRVRVDDFRRQWDRWMMCVLR